MKLESIWQRITNTNALAESSGQYETAFFGPVLRIIYLAGLSTSDYNIQYQIYSKSVQCLIIVLVSAELWYLFSVTNLDNIIDNFNVTLIHLIAMYRYWDTVQNWHIYKRLAGAMEAEMFDITTTKRRRLLEFWIQRSSLYVRLLLGLGTCTLATWYVYPLVDEVEYNLTVALRLPFKYDTPEAYPATFLLVLIAFHYTSFFVMANDLIMQTLLMHLLCQFAVCADCFENVLEDCGIKDYLENSIPNVNDEIPDDLKHKLSDRLGKLVKHHQFIVNNTLELKEVWKFPMLCQFLASSMLICFVGYQVATTITESVTKFLMSLLYLLYSMFELFIFCRWSDEIKIQSVNIGNALYSCGWEDLIGWPSLRSRIMIVLLRSSKPLVMSAGGLYDLSLASYSTLVKTSYSALTVLLRARKD